MADKKGKAAVRFLRSELKRTEAPAPVETRKYPKLPPVSRTSLNAIMKNLPRPVQEHSKRCRQLASYITERVKDDEWFGGMKLKAQDAAAAVFYHDIGKTRIPLDNIYGSKCRNARDRQIYESHTAAGLDIIAEQLEGSPDEYRPTSFEGLLISAVRDHHLADSTFAGRLAAMTDALDYFLFMDEENPEGDVHRAIEKLKSSVKLRRELIEALTDDVKTFQGFADGINPAKKPKSKALGIHLSFVPVRTVSALAFETSSTVAYITKISIYDRFFGDIPFASLAPAAEETGQIFGFEKLVIEKLCRMIRSFREKGIRSPQFILRLSIRELEKTKFSANIRKTLVKYEIPNGQLCFAFDEADIVDFGLDAADIAGKLHAAGAAFAVNAFGAAQSSLAGSLDRLKADRILISEKTVSDMVKSQNTHDLMSSLTKLALKLEAVPIFTGVRSESELEAVISASATYAAGDILAPELTQKELTEVLGEGRAGR